MSEREEKEENILYTLENMRIEGKRVLFLHFISLKH